MKPASNIFLDKIDITDDTLRSIDSTYTAFILSPFTYYAQKVISVFFETEIKKVKSEDFI